MQRLLLILFFVFVFWSEIREVPLFHKIGFVLFVHHATNFAWKRLAVCMTETRRLMFFVIGYFVVWLSTDSFPYKNFMQELPILYKIIYYIVMAVTTGWVMVLVKRVPAKSDKGSSNESKDAPDDLEKRAPAGLAPLHEALNCGRTSEARELIERGASVNLATTHKRNTPLHYAANNGTLRLSRDLNVCGDRSNDACTEFVDLIELMLSKGADPNLKNFRGNGPLHIAVSVQNHKLVAIGNPRIVRLMVKWGAHVDLRNNEGETPLAVAIRYGSEDCIRELLMCGANVHDESVVGQIRWFERTMAFIREHWIQLHAAGLQCFGDWYVEDVVAFSTVYEDYYQECLAEVDRLKNVYIGGDNTLYEWLRMRPTSRFVYVNDEKLKSLVESSSLEKQFPNYHVLIQGTYHETVARKSLTKLAVQAWHDITNIDLPDVCIEHVFGFLANADMMDLMEKHKIQSTPPMADDGSKSFTAQLGFKFRRYLE